MPIRTTAAVIALILLGTGCSGGEKVGSDKLKNFAQQSSQPKLGEATTPPASLPKATKAPVSQRTVAATRTTAAPARTASPRPVQSAPAAILRIDINGDNSTSTQFNPANAVVYKGTMVTWTNKDTQPRGVASSDGKTFRSPLIAPGKSFTWTANAVGSFDYSDLTRPYAVASLTVRARG